MDGLFSLISLEGRTSRRYFWLRQLILVCWWIGAFVLFRLSFHEAIGAEGRSAIDEEAAGSVLAFCLAGFLGAMLLSVSAVVRRYHDLGKSGVWAFICFIPVAGPIWQFIELGFLPGQRGDNQYGPGRGGGEDAFARAYSEGAALYGGDEKARPEKRPAKAPPWEKRADEGMVQNRPEGLAKASRSQFGVRGL